MSGMQEGVAGDAQLSEDGTYRYRLRRWWEPANGTVLWVMINPSTADGCSDDPTIRRCLGFTRAWGFGAIEVMNLFALRATNPARLRAVDDPIGPENDDYLIAGAQRADTVLCAWGAHGRYLDRQTAVARLLIDAGARLRHLGLTAGGSPRHPLYLRGDVEPTTWELP